MPTNGRPLSLTPLPASAPDIQQPAHAPPPTVHQTLERIASAMESIVQRLDCLTRIADRLDPPPADIIDSTVIAERLSCTSTWVSEMARSGRIPASCIVPGTGNGKPWKFYRAKIDAWLASR